VPVVARILLLRHAQSAWNAEGRWQGWADPPLSPAGEAAAAEVAANPVFDEITAAVASDLQRAATTAAVIAAVRSWPPVATYRGLRERGAGEWTGLTRADIEGRWPGALNGPVLHIPGGESTGAVTARAVATLHRVAERWPDEAVLAVTHGALIRLVEAYAGGDVVPVPNLSGRWVHVEGGRVHLGARLAPLEAAATERAG
jgi:broad specificity phosphatase PhoE